MKKLVDSIVNEILYEGDDESPSCSCGCGACETHAHPLLEEKESDFPDEYLSKHDILFTKTDKGRGSKGFDGKPIFNYKLSWNGHDIEWGGVSFSSVEQLKQYADNYVLPIKLHKKLRYKDPIK